MVRVTPSLDALRTAVTFGVRPSLPLAPVSPLSPLSPLSPFAPFFTTKEVVVPFGFLMVTVWLPSGFSVVEISGDFPSIPSLPLTPAAPWAPVSPRSPFSPLAPLAPSLTSTTCGVPSTTLPFSSRTWGVIVRVTPSLLALRTAVTFGASPSFPFSPVAPWAPVSPLSPLSPFSPFFTTKEVVVPFGFLTVTVWLPSGFSVVEISGDLPSTPSLPFSPCKPWAPVSPRSPLSPCGPWAPVSPLSPLAPSLTSTTCGAPSTMLPFSSRTWGVMVRVTPSLALLRTAVTFGARPSLPLVPAAPWAPVSPRSPLSPLAPSLTSTTCGVPSIMLPFSSRTWGVMVRVTPSLFALRTAVTFGVKPSLPLVPASPLSPFAPSGIKMLLVVSKVSGFLIRNQVPGTFFVLSEKPRCANTTGDLPSLPFSPWSPFSPCAPVSPLSPLAPSLTSTTCGVPSTMLPFSSRAWGVIVRVTPSLFALRTAVTFGARPSLPLAPAAPWAPRSPWSPFSPFSPRSPLSPCGPWAPVSPLSPFGPWAPVSPFSPCGPWAPVSPFSPCGPWAPVSPLSPFSPSLISTVCGLPSMILPFSSRTWGVMVRVTPSLFALRTAVTFGVRPSLPFRIVAECVVPSTSLTFTV